MPFGAISELFQKPGSLVSKITPLGGVSFLFTFESVADMTSMTNNQTGWISQIFSSFRAWKEGDSAINRLCWILVRGVPANAWSSDFFRLIMSSVGSMVDWSSQAASKSKMDVAEILILTDNNAFINKLLSVKIGHRFYKIGLFESQYDPLDWDWSTHGASDVVKSDQANYCEDDGNKETPTSSSVQLTSPSDPAHAVSKSRKPYSPKNEYQQTISASPMSEDLFRLWPIIDQMFSNPEPPQLSQRTGSSKSIPSEPEEHAGIYPSDGPTKSQLTTVPTTEPHSPAPFAPSPTAPLTAHSQSNDYSNSNYIIRPLPINPFTLPLVPWWFPMRHDAEEELCSRVLTHVDVSRFLWLVVQRGGSLELRRWVPVEREWRPGVADGSSS
ncbi:hypothetical protein Tsubulata_027419 [Turnera subulata]|uniref:DUF4283 domain-containing protein n=1 Tax=Turnera subulata TaxID=218843 RepID=A0A9Q0FQU3_9ROSI|nr:hypothetical protein Tsubulata_027419 [Turnera subulata]